MTDPDSPRSPPGAANAPPPPHVRAANPGLFTLDGTRSYLIGERRAVLIDPGPDLESHVAALLSLVRGVERLTIALTHGHADHAGAAGTLAGLTGADIVGPGHPEARRLEDGDELATDQGSLYFLSTPGHTRDHGAYLWPERSVLFPGDLVLGEGSTTWVGEYPEAVADYLRSLDRVEAFELRTLFPSHGPAVTDPVEHLRRYRRHRIRRVDEVARLLEVLVDPTPERIAERVYGTDILESSAGRAAHLSVLALMHHLGRTVDFPTLPGTREPMT